VPIGKLNKLYTELCGSISGANFTKATGNWHDSYNGTAADDVYQYVHLEVGPAITIHYVRMYHNN